MVLLQFCCWGELGNERGVFSVDVRVSGKDDWLGEGARGSVTRFLCRVARIWGGFFLLMFGFGEGGICNFGFCWGCRAKGDL